MPSTNEEQARRHRERYATDPEFRKRILAASQRARKKHYKTIRSNDNAKKRMRYATDKVYKAHKRRCNDIWDRENKERRAQISRNNHLLSKYGLASEEYEQMVADRKGRCDICGDQPERLCVDHDHGTKVVRGLLCRNCNSALGKFKDSTQILRNAIIYLSIMD